MAGEELDGSRSLGSSNTFVHKPSERDVVRRGSHSRTSVGRRPHRHFFRGVDEDDRERDAIQQDIGTKYREIGGHGFICSRTQV